MNRPQRGSSQRGNSRRDADPLVCFCNEVPQSEIDRAIRCGARTLAEIFDATFAGCGPCGGSCQPDLQRILAERAQRPPRP